MSLDERANQLVENGLAKLLFRTLLGMVVGLCAFLLQAANSRLDGVAAQLVDLKTSWAVGQAVDKGNHDALTARIDALTARVNVVEQRARQQ